MVGAETFSISHELRGKNVLLTGATGYVGGLVLECLLRTSDVHTVYVLLRSKGSVSASERCKQLLQKNMFHKVRDNKQLLAKVSVVEGDILQPELGLSPTDRQQLQQEVSVILHAAADIRLEVDIQTALTANFLGTQAMLQLASSCKQLLAFVHVSSTFVNMNQPVGSVVGEVIYPLRCGHQEVDAHQLVQELMCLPPEAADMRASALGSRWSFPNNYTLSKHLAEQLVSSFHTSHKLPAAIVRPSLVCAVAYEPIPGYVGNYAGPIGASAALALGFYHSLKCVSSQPLHCWDIMPADFVANAVLATAAAVAASSNGNTGALLAAKQAAAAGAVSAGAAGAGPPPLLIVHSSSSSTYPLTLMEGWNHAVEFIRAHPPRFRLSLHPPPTMTPHFRPDPAAVRRERRWLSFKVAVACWLLRVLGLGRAAARLHSGFEALCVYGTSKTDKDLVFDSSALQSLEAALPATERLQFPLVMRPGMAAPAGQQQACAGIEASATPAAVPEQQGCIKGSSSREQHSSTLTWRRFFHSQLAAVYSLLFRMKVPAAVAGVNAVVVQHDFVFVK